MTGEHNRPPRPHPAFNPFWWAVGVVLWVVVIYTVVKLAETMEMIP
jgi:hypothetical protein